MKKLTKEQYKEKQRKSSNAPSLKARQKQNRVKAQVKLAKRRAKHFESLEKEEVTNEVQSN